MAEPKRIQLTTVASKPEVKDVKKPSVTVRLDLSLADSTDKTCPEFFYKDLVKKRGDTAKDDKANQSTDDPFGDEEDAEHEKMAEIAKRFEDKYGPKLGAKKRKKLGRIKDLVDLGDGYDMEDPFIDNSEAYDEIVPQCLTTRHGGFYINTGKLDFREIKDDSDDDFVLAKKKGKKRTITSDSESEGEEKVKKKRKLKDGFLGEKKKKKLLNADGEKIFKKPKKPIDKDKLAKKKKTSPTVSELLKQQSQSTSAPVSHSNGSILDMDVQSPSTNDETSQDALDRIDSIIDSVIAMNSGDQKNLDSIILDTGINLDKEDSGWKDDGSKSQDPASIPELPSNIPKELESTIKFLKEKAKNSRDGKCKFFTNEVNDKLLVIEVESKKLGSCGQRSKIYNHLAAFLPCSKDTLLKRAKKLHQSRQDDEIKEPIEKLRDAINGMMPALQEKYEAECQKQAQQKQEENAKEEAPKDNDTEDSDEEKSQSTIDTNKKGPKGVRKKFEWTESIRSLLCEIVRIKMKSYEVAKKGNQTAEEYLKQFLETDIRPLWPKGWMQTRTLFKESRAAHSIWTVPQKPKKPVNVLMSKSAASTSNSNSTPPQQPTNNNIPKFTPGSTPVRPTSTYEEIKQEMAKKAESSTGNKALPARGVPTLLDYASTENTSESQKSNTSLASVSSASAGLSLLASSAANQKYMDRSWDHVVSDIIKTSLSPKKSEQASPSNPLKSPESSFLEQFQKYAMLQQQQAKDISPGVDLAQANKMASLLMQTKAVNQQQHMQQKLKSALQGQPSADSNSASKPVTKHVSKLDSGITVQTMQSKPKASGAGMKPKPGISLSSEDVFRHFLQESGKLPQNVSSLTSSQRTAQKSSSNQVRTPSQSIGQNPVSNTHNPSPTGLKVSGVQKPPYSGIDLTISPGNAQTSAQMKLQRTSPNSIGQMSRPGQSLQGQGHSLLKNSNSSSGMQQMYGKIDGQSSGMHSYSKQPSPSSMHSYTKQPSPSSLNKSLSPSTMQSKSISPSSGYSNKSVSPAQGKAQNTVWSVASMTQGTSQKTSTSPFPQPHLPQVHKPVPGYQGLKLSNNPRDTISSSTPTIPQSPVQAHLPSPDILSPLGISPTSPLFPVTQGALLHNRLAQTSPLSQQAGRYPPYSTSPLHQHPQYSQFTDKPRQPHGY